MEAQFFHYCKVKLELEESMIIEAMHLYRVSKHILTSSLSTFGSGLPEEKEKYRWAFIVHCVIKLTKERSKKENQATVTLPDCEGVSAQHCRFFQGVSSVLSQSRIYFDRPL